MRMTVTLGINQIISHGFGLFLFAALVPLMQASIEITHWHLASIGALTQLAYLAGAMLLGLIGHHVNSGRLLLVTGSITTLLLFSMSLLNDPMVITLVLTVMAASAAISWGGIVELITRYGRPENCATNLATASSGTAWGYGLNGLLILLVIPLFGWRSGWILAGALGAATLLLTLSLLRSLKQRHENHLVEESTGALSPLQLFRTILRERTAFCACLICFLVGASTMPFSNWLNTYLAELSLPPALGGYTWTITGLTGMAAGFLIGKLADRRGHGLALLIIFAGFALGLLAFAYSPARFAAVAGFCYGLMYFPMWGIVAGWVSRQYGSKATMQINGIGMVTFGLGGALGNLVAGFVRESSGSLSGVYALITGLAILLTLVAGFICVTERQPKPPFEPAF
ncbi:MFS transporter [Marinobacterium lutimaris]|uniref:Sugar phosphate permease n=1 Tax=Marinobacterium lutimaris TaxID=568106 RepID=A0A1H6CQZ4_9GAMM|nr:MFS transporter [Marinobacterium lutimaris]SEG75384.1 Sugar phosphate permease [Marinobacterium lutimaris]